MLILTGLMYKNSFQILCHRSSTIRHHLINQINKEGETHFANGSKTYLMTLEK